MQHRRALLAHPAAPRYNPCTFDPTTSKEWIGFVTSPQESGFGDLLRQLRRRAGMTQTDLAAAVGYSVALISSLEKGNRLPDVAVVAARFVPALALLDDMALAARLVEAAAAARGQPRPVTVSVTRSVTVAVEEFDAPDLLPAPPTPLVGRARDVDLICRRLAGHQGRLITLTGAPGVGKTRLALAVAHHMAPVYADGARFVDLAAVEDTTHVAAALALALDLELGRADPAAQVAAHLRRKELLLVLDNMEQLLAAAPFVRELLAACPGVRVVATSRERLHLRGEQRFRVAPLVLEAATELFAARAAAGDPSFAVTPANRGAVEQICRELDCLPLAIELCAAHVGVYTPDALLARLCDHRLDMLRDGPSDLPARHHTLANAIHRSYLLLTPRQQQLLCGLAPFVGGFDLDAVTFLGYTADDLRALVDKSLVHPAFGQTVNPRYALYATIRAYAQDRLAAAAETAAAQQIHAAFCLALAAAGAGPDDAYLDRCARDLDNLRAALRHWIDARDHGAVRLAAALRDFWYGRGHLTEGRVWLTQALAVDAVADAARGYALLSAGQLAHNQGDHPPAHTALAAALAIFTDLADPRGRAAVLNELAWLQFDDHVPAAAVDCFEQSIALVRVLGDPGWLATLLSSTAMVLGYQDRYDPRVRAYFAEAIDLHRTVDDPSGRAYALLQLAVVDGLEGRYAAARQLAEDGLALLTTLERPRDLAWAYEVVGEARWLCNDLDGADDAYRQARTRFDKLGVAEGVMLTEHHFGQLARRRGQFAAAETHYRISLLLALQHADVRMVGRSLAGLGAVAWAAGDPTQAAILLAAAWQRFDSVPPFLAPCDEDDYFQARRAVSAALAPAVLASAWSDGATRSAASLLEICDRVTA
jgi:predicted ATPase/DNA-binding XRE family transcriptional regulator